MVTSLFKYERIRTTDTKAKGLRTWADRLITLAKRGDMHARRQALAIIREKKVVYKLFDEAQERFGSVSGGYTRIIKMGRRPGDAAAVSMIELISAEKISSKKTKSTKKTKPVKAKAVEEKVKADKKEVKPADEKIEDDSAPEKKDLSDKTEENVEKE
jgi:large subunit ribosomal protein L17